MDFAPYQSESPDTSRRSLNLNRPLSPPAQGRSYSPLPPSSPPPVLPTHQPGGGWAGNRETVNQFETSLPIRYTPFSTSPSMQLTGVLDWTGRRLWHTFCCRQQGEFYCLSPSTRVTLSGLFSRSVACAYGANGVRGGRFHAWQSSLLFAFLVVSFFTYRR